MATSFVAIQALRATTNLTGIPVVQTILNTASLVFESAKVARSNRFACIRVAQLVNETLEIVRSELEDTTVIQLSPGVSGSLERLNGALEIVLGYVQSQANANFVRRLMPGTGERDAREALSRALATFQTECKIHLQIELRRLLTRRTEQQEKVLEILDQTADGVTDAVSELQTRTLPVHRLLFGRDLEQLALLKLITSAPTSSPARIVVLGGGGMGKSTLALSILHHPSMVERFGEYRYFISCESAASSGGLVSEIASHVGIFGDQLRKRVLAALKGAQLLLVLDNFETPWEAMNQRMETEKFLGELSTLQNLTLIVTMRGGERPLGTSWTTPILEPLSSLDLTASRQIFSAVTDLTTEQEQSTELPQFLNLLDGIPLAVTLAANMAREESIPALLRRWHDDGTTAIRTGSSGTVDRLSSLDVSIKLSVESSRMANTPGAFELLQLLALLPNGIPEKFSHPSFKSLPRATSALKMALLASSSEDGRLRSLSPIRNYVLLHHPPPYLLIAPLEREYVEMTKIIGKLGTLQTKEVLTQLITEWANIESVCGYCLDHVIEATWPISIVAKFDRMLHFTAMPPSALLERVSASHTAADRLKVLILLRQVCRAPSRAAQSVLCRQAIEIAQVVEDEPLLAEAEFRLGNSQADPVVASVHLRSALSRYDQLGADYRMQQGLCWEVLGNKAFFKDAYAESLEYAARAITCYDATGHITGALTTQIHMTYIYLRQGLARKAEAVALECLRLCLSIDSLGSLDTIYEGLASILLARGKLSEALQMNALSQQYHQRFGSPPALAFQKEIQSDILIEMGDILASRAAFDEAARLVPNRSPWENLCHIARAATLARVEGSYDEADSFAHTAIELSRKLNASRMEIYLHLILAETSLDQARDAEQTAAVALATEALHRAILSLVLCSRINNMLHLINCISLLGRSLLAAGWDSEAHSVLTWGVEWSARADFMTDHAVMLVALARLTDKTQSSAEEKRMAWETALDKSRSLGMGRLVADCEVNLPDQ
ncbi:hypothetical protein BKA62DRAFT_511838 [Auriculariales sp. MPI-PUGE-AT-0066]|nr:hypothetical protein BKA62DRAFT_511838 [Auriculariales sp. MPI-PUGE-AT-0066]